MDFSTVLILIPDAEPYNGSDGQTEYFNNLMFLFLKNRGMENIFKMCRLSSVLNLSFLKYFS
ncbi:hypothetical protein C4Q31_01490 [Leptospira borgpetersenii serovar Ceylonica]|nr:hypothetical protein C4Q31_01490 [Leptospira borgpetersenii serovar Ceylonica]OOV45338.1 hypothetical protein B1H38_04825 [Leptospira borgpetersenii serovar Ballum]